MTPVLLVLCYVFGLLGWGQMHLSVFCGTWLVYSLIGLEWRGRIGLWLRARDVRMGALVAMLVICVLVQEVEGFCWLAVEDYDLATTQLKLSAMASSCAFILMAMGVSQTVRQRVASCRALVALGDCSFGVYLCHIAAVMLFSKVFSVLGLPSAGAALSSGLSSWWRPWQWYLRFIASSLEGYSTGLCLSNASIR